MTISHDRKYIRSTFLVQQPVAQGILTYHSLHGRPIVLNSQAQEFLDLFTLPRSLSDLREVCTVEDDERWFTSFVRRGFLRPAHEDERADFVQRVARAVKESLQPEALMSLGLVVDEGCNFDCPHCVAKKLLRVTRRTSPKHRRMTWDVARPIIDAFASLMHQRGRATMEIFFGGSEPFLNWSVIEKSVRYCEEVYGGEFALTFYANSNASLFTPERARFLCDHHITVSTSVDGLESTNDHSRVTASGHGTFRRIMRGWENLARYGQPVVWCSVTLTDRNIDQIDEQFFDWLKKRGIVSCTFENDLLEPLAKTPDELVALLMRFKDWGDARGIAVGGLWDKPLRNLFERKLEHRLFNCSAFSGRGLTVLPNGDLVLCVYSSTRLGTINDLARYPLTPEFLKLATQQSAGSIPACYGCPIEGQCMGGCYLTPEYGRATQSDTAFQYRCEVFRRATRALLQRTVSVS